jgi:outer membrane protein assembly factor BamB
MTDRRSRRAVLATSGAVLSALAGCAGFIQNGDSSESDGNGRDGTETDTPTVGPGTPTRTPQHDADENGDGTGGTETDQNPSDESYVWRYEYGGSVDAVVEGLVLARQSFTNDTDGGLVGLDVETGTRRWQYGSTNGLGSIYTDLTVEDAIYLGQGDDQIGGGTGKLMAVEFDGTERWSLETGTIYQQPVVADRTVYAGSDDGTVRAVDADTGSVRFRNDGVPWDFTSRSAGPVVEAVDDVVYVAATTLVALDPADGTIRWQYGDADSPDSHLSDLVVSDGVAYVAVAETGVSAIEGGEERWHTSLDGNLQVRGVHDGTVLVAVSTGEGQAAVHALDSQTGTRQWSIEGLRGTLVPMAVDSERLYVDEGSLVAYRLADGTADWETTVDGTIRLVTVDEQDGTSSIYVTDEGTVSRVTASGDLVQSVQLAKVGSVAVDQSAFVGARTGIYRVDIE